jgi:hypothetical protein
MKPVPPTFALLLLAGWPTVAIAGDWYVHRTSHQMSVRPGYCYCYRVSTASVLQGTVSYPMDMQISRERAFSKLANMRRCRTPAPTIAASVPTRAAVAGRPLRHNRAPGRPRNARSSRSSADAQDFARA